MVARGNPNYFITYGNGKSGTLSLIDRCQQKDVPLHCACLALTTAPAPVCAAARVQQGMRPNGAHRWHSYVKTPK